MILRYMGMRAGPTVLTAAVLLNAACGSVTVQSDETADTAGSVGGAPVAGTTGIDNSRSIAFDPSNLTVSVLARSTVTVRVTPAGGQAVTFALIGNSLDASLESAQVPSDVAGLASVTLTAPSLPTSFSIRASLDRSTVAETQVKVVEATTGSIDVTVKYSGTRQVETYSIALYPDKDCSSPDLNGTTQHQPSISTTTLPIHIEATPLARALAVVVDGDKTVHGCTAVRGVGDQSSLSVEVPLEDLPVNFYGTTLDLSMSTVDGLQALKDNVGASIPTIVAAMVLGNHDLTDLLAAMETTATGSLQQEFANLRSASNWNAFVVDAYDSIGGIDLLRRQLRTWLTQGVELFSTQPTFEVRLYLGPLDFVAPHLELIRIAGVNASTQLLMQNGKLALNPESNDHLDWSSTLSFGKATLLDMLAFTAASVDLPGMENVPAQLAKRLDCDAFGNQLDQHAVWTNSNSRVCTAACLATLCRSGLSTMYDRATAAAFGVPTTLLVNASGKVVLDTNAQPISTTGAWIGAFSAESTPVAISGTYERR